MSAVLFPHQRCREQKREHDLSPLPKGVDDKMLQLNHHGMARKKSASISLHCKRSNKISVLPNDFRTNCISEIIQLVKKHVQETTNGDVGFIPLTEHDQVKQCNKIFSILALCGIFSPLISLANDHGFYFGSGIGLGETALTRPLDVTTFNRDGQAWSVSTGYQFDRIIAIEAGFFRMHNVNSISNKNGVIISDIIRPGFTFLAIRGQYRILKRLNVFVRVGASRTEIEETLRTEGEKTTRFTSALVPFLSMGITYNLSRRFSLNCSVADTLQSGLMPRLSAVMIGLQYSLTGGR